jgi:oxaloacetate decarboxylase (Na+ extruding) subunit gamma
MEDLVLESSKVVEGFKFMVLGMGTVFSFLIVMIGTMNLQSYIIHKFFPEPEVIPENSSRKTDKNAKVAAITAAVMHHKNAKS